MRTVLRLVLVTAVLGLTGPVNADENAPAAQTAPATRAKKNPQITPWYRNPPPEEPCWGDSTENDTDLNAGSRFTVEEILRIINPPGT